MNPSSSNTPSVNTALPVGRRSAAGQPRSAVRRTSPCQLGDAIIAGVAWFNDAIVVTRNPADFEVQGVRVLGYE